MRLLKKQLAFKTLLKKEKKTTFSYPVSFYTLEFPESAGLKLLVISHANKRHASEKEME